METGELIAAVNRMDEIISRGIQVTVQPSGAAPIVCIKVLDPEDHVLVPEITELALMLYGYHEASNGQETQDLPNQ